MRPVGEKSLQRTMDAVSADTAPTRAQAPLVAPYPFVERTTMKSGDNTGRLAPRKLFILVAASLAWVLLASLVWATVTFII